MKWFAFGKGKKRKLIWGILFLLGAVAILLSSLGYLGGLSFWPVLFSVILIMLFIDGIIKRGIGQILFSAACFVIVNDELLHLEAITPWPVLGAALLGTVGLRLLFPKWRRKFRFVMGHHNIMGDHKAIAQESRSGDSISYENVFGSAVKYVTGEISCVDVENAFGSMEIYFSDAVPKGGSVRLSVETAFGSVSVYIPPSWRVVQNMETAFGSVEMDENSSAEIGDGSTLYLEGEVNFGSLEVHYI